MSACPLNSGCNTGNCQFCDQKGDCVLLAILQKVANLESIMASMAGQTA
jgi:hypothetical protein